MENVWAMSNVRPIKTGLPMVIWIKPRGNENHGPRIKVQKEHGEKAREGFWVSVTIEDRPRIIGSGLSDRDFKLVEQFIKLNKIDLLKVWNDEVDPSDIVNNFKKI